MKKTTEAGKRNNSVDQARIQQMHDNAVELGADCMEPDADDAKAKESARVAPWLREAVLRAGDSAAAKHQAIGKAVDAAYQGSRGYAYTRDVFPKHVVVSHGDKMYAHPYSTDESGNVNLGDPVEVESTYSPMKESDFLECVVQGPLRISERNIPQSVRDNADAGDFAGKGKSFPILKAEDVKAALSSIGRAGSGNYSAAELKSRILAIAKRKGFAIPASDKESGTQLADGLVRLEESCVDLIEKSVRADGTIPIKVIAPGWGASGYYPAEVLERDGPKVFSKGLHMYLDHPTPTEESERPERSVKDLAATLTSNARWMENGSAGAGLYADAQVTSPYRQFIEEIAPQIGVSIRAAGTAESGQAEGRKGPIIKSLAQAESIDFVTRAGAGGKILQLYEAARTRQTQSTGAIEMDEQELKQLREAAADGERLREVVILREAKDFVSEKLAKVEHLPDMVKARLTESLSKNPPVAGEGKDRKLDNAAFDTKIAEGIKSEVAYLASLGIGDGKVRGMGTSAATDADPKKLTTDLTESFKRLGLNDKLAGIAATGRPN
jgi:hypothetical protein